MSNVPRGKALAQYVAAGRGRSYSGAVLHEARRALVDTLGLMLVAAHDGPVEPVRRTVARWQAQGRARIVLGGTTTPALAALINATAVHAMDFDDVHYMGAGHLSGPCWSAALAMGQAHDAGEQDVLSAFLTGFEVMARLGGGGVPGVGRSLQRRGFHPTSVVGRMGAAASAAVIHGLDEKRALHALSHAGTTAGGLLASFGTHGKPFHSGKAAMDGILAADMAADGYIGAEVMFEAHGGWLDAFIQDHQVEIPPVDDFDSNHEILRNGYKVLASCRGTHAATQAAQELFAQIARRSIRHVRVFVHPGALVTAGKRAPATHLDAKFSVSFCVAMGLSGYRLAFSDFTLALMQKGDLADLEQRVELVVVEGQSPASSQVEVQLEDGSVLRAEAEIMAGHPDNPVNDQVLSDKFLGLVVPVIGAAPANELLQTLWNFGDPHTLAALDRLITGKQ